MKDLSMHILDIARNSVEAGASQIEVILKELPDMDLLQIIIEDNGKGIPKDVIEEITDPYFTGRNTRKVGLGLALLKQNTENTGGNLNIESEINKGTRVEANFCYQHIDRPPLGDISSTILLLMTGNPEINVIYRHHKNDKQYSLSTQEIKEALDGMSFQSYEIRKYLKEMIDEHLTSINVI